MVCLWHYWDIIEENKMKNKRKKIAKNLSLLYTYTVMNVGTL